MDEPIIILQGITLEQFREELKAIVRAEIAQNEDRKVSPLSKKEACDQLGITYNTLIKVMSEMNLTDIYPSDINRILLKYPKYIKKAIRA
ncbi:MAG: hypothetical protein PHP53_07355 [Prolixibacteraceae bacterium]|nr:hypothetical protein [Prolixibacteraceae bacterium]